MTIASSPAVRVQQAGVLMGVSANTIWRWAKTRPDFPRPIKLSPQTTVWKEADLIAWRDKQAAK
ncbi:AlpA family phage regulatory protein [Polaromonas sp.]|uniref:helix-turn-helix transcriptional regulator n=1 Tax=Polaromonas sp. TaxID=1869339 RepID=UPI003266887C